jgi:hypothetical protein
MVVTLAGTMAECDSSRVVLSFFCLTPHGERTIVAGKY